ncbi:MAG TPA: 2OG-Fe(II) oxygenase [Kofleriaceae bacterium]|nr:2OG-Fe(II) oxygenase [Kofleriaceae bacterium]
MSEWVRCHGALEAWSFDRVALAALGKQRRREYQEAQPYPHAVIDGLLGQARSTALARAFPPPEHPGWKRRDYAEQAGRLGQLQRTGFEDVAPPLRWLLAELGGMAFLDFLGALTGRRDLIADPHYTGAGPMATLPGGHLALHIDFNRDSARHLDRVATALYYLPAEWDEAWGGELELWDRARTRCEVKLAPLRDRLVVMAHGEDHWHGHPAPLRCPPGSWRAVVAAHYYAARAGADDDASAHGAIWGESA